MANEKVVTNRSNEKQKAARLRSPNYPGINLETAIQRAQKFWENEKRNAANVAVAMKHWGFVKPTSQSIVTLAAVKSFGLFEDSGSGENRKIKLSDLALKIILDQRQISPEREAAIKEAALKPMMHSKLWSRWGAQLPSDENLRHALIFEYKFNENAVDGFIEEFKDTITYSKLQNSDSITASENDINGTEEATKEEAQPMPELQIQTGKTATSAPPGVPVPAGSKPVGASIPVTRECSMTVMASGPVTQKGIDQLMAYLKLVRDSFPEN